MATQEIIAKHEQMLYPTIRMRTREAGGSGTVIFSSPNAKGEVETYVLGCHHVVESAISVKEDWDSLAGRNVRKERLSTVTIEPFRYNNYSHCVGGAASLEGDIVAYNSRFDLALIKLRDKENTFTHVASMIPKDSLDEIHVFDQVWCAGAALGHPPLVTTGELMCLDDEIEDLKYMLSNAMSIFGNSGGAIFRYSEERNRYEYIGIPARITTMPKGFFGFETVSWMGYGIPPERLYQFLEGNCYQFIYDDSKTIEECQEERNKKQAEARKVLERMYGIVE